MASTNGFRRGLPTIAAGLGSCRCVLLLAAGLVVGLAANGCQRSPYELAPVRGQVTIDGQPLSGGRVMFAPIGQDSSPNSGKPSFGTLQPDGIYILSTYQDNDGAVVGEHWVTIFGPETDAGLDRAGNHQTASLPAFGRFVVREKQSVRPGQENQIDLRLNSQDIDRFASQR